MKYKEIILCILFLSICSIFDKFTVFSVRNPAINFFRKLSFLRPYDPLVSKKTSCDNNVYINLLDSTPKSGPLKSNYSEYVRDNKCTSTSSNPKSLQNILSIETSFDDTCVAVLRSDGEILSEEKLSQTEIVQQYGGLHPYLSQLDHKDKIELLSDKVIKDSGLKIDDIDHIAVTRGPGTELCLRVGYNFALDLSKKHNIPLVSENHIAAHCLSPLIKGHQFKYTNGDRPEKSNDLKYPYLCLLLSGAHSQIYLVQNPSTFHLICDTQDQYSGSVLDKCARHLGLPLDKGGGPMLELAARNVTSSPFKFTVPNEKSDFSEFCFSGIESQLKTTLEKLMAKYRVASVKSLPETLINQLAFSVQTAVFDKVIAELDRALEVSQTFFPINQLVVVGGVACNKKLKKMIVDLLYQRDDSVLFEKQRVFMKKIHLMIRKYLDDKRYTMSKDNPYVPLFKKFKEKVTSLDQLVHYLWNPDLFPDLLTVGHMPKVGTKHKNELYKEILNLYFDFLGKDKLRLMKRAIDRLEINYTLMQPSAYILNILKNDKLSPCPIVSPSPPSNTRWYLYSTSPKYSTDNAVMIGFSLLEKQRAGIASVRNLDRIDGRDVLPRWNLGSRKSWEILSSICKLDSLIRF